ncbi:MAG: 6-carboxytetrahydropterin synthase [Chlorobi bacterium]|nr:6-carboxytetrahydropterin synthase [Chlorobiota bacterium]
MKPHTNIAEIGKEFRWEMGHRLPFHEGGCRNVHGHSYRMHVSVTGELDENGMVVDYFDLREIVDPLIEQIDHAFLCDTSDTDMLAFLEKHEMKRVIVNFPSTAENIAQWLLDQVVEPLQRYKNLKTIAVRLHETERTYAEVKFEVRS